MATSSAVTHSHRLDTTCANLRLVHRAPVGSLQYDLEQAFNDEDHCNVTIVVNGFKVRVHELVLCLTSKVLDKALNSKCREAIERSFNWSRYGHRVACEFVRFCYQRSYDTIECTSSALLLAGSLQDYDGLLRVNGNLVWQASDSDLQIATKVVNESNSRRFLLDVEMYKMGDIYDVPSLRSQAAHKLEWRLYEYSCAKGSPGPLLDLIAPVYEYTGSDRNILRRLLFRGLRSFKRSIHQDRAARSTLQTLRKTVRGFDAACQRIFAGPPTNWRDKSFGWPSTGH